MADATQQQPAPADDAVNKKKEKEKRALDRFLFVWLIQLSGALTVLAVLAAQLKAGGWQWDCFWIGLIGGFGMFVVLCIAFVCIMVRGINPAYTECLIFAVYTVNTFALSLGVARTGGPISSLFAP